MSGFRSMNYGLFDAEWAYFVAHQIRGHSIRVDGYTADADNGGTHQDDLDWLDLNKPTIQYARKGLVRFNPAGLLAVMGPSPLLLAARWAWYTQAVYNATVTARLWRIASESSATIDFLGAKTAPLQVSFRYKDLSAGLTWYGDAYSPVPGQDVDPEPCDEQSWAQVTTAPVAPTVYFDILEELQESLDGNLPLAFLLTSPTNVFQYGPRLLWWYGNGFGGTPSAQWRPHFQLKFLYPFEFYHCVAATGVIDPTRLAGVSGSDRYYLGPVEPGETGAALKCALRNWGSVDIPHFEVQAKAHATWTVPVQKAGAGTGQLDYASPIDEAKSQRYRVKFSNATDFVVLGYAHGNNPTNFNTSEADPTWQGDINTTFTAPVTGGVTPGLVLVPEAWQPGFLAADEWEFYITGGTSDPAWPADSAEQVQVTEDDSGSPLVAGWRPANGRRTRSSTAVTIDGATKQIPVLAIESSLWVVDTPCFVGDRDHIDRGTVSAAGEAEIGTPVFTGAGLDDAVIAGNYHSPAFGTLRIKIDATAGSPDTFSWCLDGAGETWEATGVPCSLTPTYLGSTGICISFGAVDGHTIGDFYDAPLQPFYVTIQGMAVSGNVYAAGARVGTTLPIRDTAATIRGTSDAESASGQVKFYVPGGAALGFLAGQTLFLQSIDDEDTNEEIVIGNVQATWIEMTTNLAHTYPAGSYAVVKTSGVAYWWQRIVSVVGTAIEQKVLRYSQRT